MIDMPFKYHSISDIISAYTLCWRINDNVQMHPEKCLNSVTSTVYCILKAIQTKIIFELNIFIHFYFISLGSENGNGAQHAMKDCNFMGVRFSCCIFENERLKGFFVIHCIFLLEELKFNNNKYFFFGAVYGSTFEVISLW